MGQSKNPIKLVEIGQPIKASDFNALAQGVMDLRDFLSNTKGGGGLEVKVTESGLLIALLGIRDRIFPVKITQAPPPDVALLPSACKYGYRGIGQSFVETQQVPVYGRPVQGDECAVYPAKVGHLAAVFLNPQDDGTNIAELWILTEVPARGPCS